LKVKKLGKFDVRIDSYVNGELTHSVVENRVVYVGAENKNYINWMEGTKQVIKDKSGMFVCYDHAKSLSICTFADVMADIQRKAEERQRKIAAGEKILCNANGCKSEALPKELLCAKCKEESAKLIAELSKDSGFMAFSVPPIRRLEDGRKN
jgi:hypothetical protein